jgi:CIC family chloride channel protein
MAAVLAGVVRSPITAIMLVFELTNDYRLILPIMLAAVVCILMTSRFTPHGVYTMGLARQGIHLQEGRDIDLMQGILVHEVMDPPRNIAESASLIELRDTLRQHHVRSLTVIDEDNRLAGIVTLTDLQQAFEDHEDEAITFCVGDICTRKVISTNPDDVLWRAIRLMGAHDVGRLPVVNDTNELVGMLSRHDIVEAYNKAVARKLQDQHQAERVRLTYLTGAHVLEVIVADHAPVVGQHIQDIHWPAESTVASIQRRNKLLVPHGSTELRPGDWVTLVAAPECADELERLFGQRPITV